MRNDTARITTKDYIITYNLYIADLA